MKMKNSIEELIEFTNSKNTEINSIAHTYIKGKTMVMITMLVVYVIVMIAILVFGIVALNSI